MSESTSMSQYLTFSLDGEVYALEVFKVREVLEPSRITRVPRMPDYMLGVINLRGSVVPVIDLRLKLGLEASRISLESGIIILEFDNAAETGLMGILVDSVYEVVNIATDVIEPPPSLGTHVKSDFISGVGKQNDSFIMLMDIGTIFSELDESPMSSWDAVDDAAEEDGPIPEESEFEGESR